MLSRIAEELRHDRKVVLVYYNADMDAVGLAYMLSRAFLDADIYAPSGLDKVSRMVTMKMGVKVLEFCDLSAYDRVVVMDISFPSS